MLFRPTGLIPERRRKQELEEGVHDDALYDVRTRAPTPTGRARVRKDLPCSTRRSVRKEFGGLVASNDVDFTIPRGSIVSLIGPNGAGKTTFFNMLTGVYKPTAGTIIFDGTDITGMPPHAITRLGIGRTFQNIRLFPQMTALENVLVGMHSRLHAGGISAPIFRTPRIAARGARGDASAARELLRYSGLRARHDAYASQPALRRPAPARGGARARAPSRSCCCSTSRPPA